MMLDVKEVARLLTVPEKMVYRWISQNEIPTYKIGQSYRFNRVELLEWATARKMKVSSEIFAEPGESDDTMPTLSEALAEGGIHTGISGADKRGVLEAIVATLPLPSDIDPEFLVAALLARENLGSTAIGDGIAIPHVRNPIIFHVDKPLVALCFLEKPIDFDALDGKPVDTMFVLITHTVRSHLYLLSRLAYALHQPEVRSLLVPSSRSEDIFDALSRFDRGTQQKSSRN